jgi:hypothetical protein
MKFASVAVTAIFSLLLIGSGDSEAAEEVYIYSGPVTQIEGIVQQIEPVLVKYHQTARIDFHTNKCGPGGGGPFDFRPVPFPTTIVRPPNTDTNALAAIQSIFRDEPSVLVVQDNTGLIRLRIGHVSNALLETKINKIKFTPETQYNIAFAIDALEDAPAVKTAMVRLKRHPNLLPYIGGVMDPTPGWPHLPPQASHTTYGELLDTIAMTFGGIVSHGECDDPGRINTNFHYVFDVKHLPLIGR